MLTMTRVREISRLGMPATSDAYLRQTLQFFIFLYLLVATIVVVMSQPVLSMGNAEGNIEAMASILLLGLACLRFALAIERNRYALMDGILDASILLTCYLMQQTPVITNIAYYFAVTAIALLLPARSTTIFVIIMLASNLLAAIGLHFTASSSIALFGHDTRREAWQFFMVNLVAMPYIGFFIHSLSKLAHGRGEDHTALLQMDQALQASREQLQQSERMANLGRMASSITHEMNNSLNATLNSLELIQRHVGMSRVILGSSALPRVEREEMLGRLDRLANLGQRAAQQSIAFIRSLREHSEHAVHTVEVDFSPGALVTDIAELMHYQCEKDNCRLLLGPIEAECTLHGDPGKFAQVVMNLITNAIDAYCDMTAPSSRNIHVSLRHGDHGLELQVTDHGSGISREHLPHIFQPYYTTKAKGKGMGIGLSIVQEIVTQHFNGAIDVRSTQGDGATFTVLLPLPEIDLEQRLDMA